MKRLLITFCLVLLPGLSLASSGSHKGLDKVYINLNDKASLQRGARLFNNFCLSCHSAKYMRYNRVAKDLDIPEDVMKKNLIFGDHKAGDLMKTTMPAADAKQWFGVTPPDLTLAARVRDPNWIYTYLRSFYLDEKSPSGWNNSLFENVAMPHILYELQGSQSARFKTLTDTITVTNKDGSTSQKDITHEEFDHFELEVKGTMNPKEYDEAVRDITNFMVYLAEPIKLERYRLGVYVLLFLVLFFLVSLLLKKEYWRDIH